MSNGFVRKAFRKRYFPLIVNHQFDNLVGCFTIYSSASRLTFI